jgi:hypothetical protein
VESRPSLVRVEFAGPQMGISRLPQGIDKSSSNMVFRTFQCIDLSPVVELHEAPSGVEEKVASQM